MEKRIEFPESLMCNADENGNIINGSGKKIGFVFSTGVMEFPLPKVEDTQEPKTFMDCIDEIQEEIYKNTVYKKGIKK